MPRVRLPTVVSCLVGEKNTFRRVSGEQALSPEGSQIRETSTRYIGTVTYRVIYSTCVRVLDK